MYTTEHTTQNIGYLPERVEKPDDLYNACVFARSNELNLMNFLQSHILLTERLLPANWRGIYRMNVMLVMDYHTGRVHFEAAPCDILETGMDRLWLDFARLMERKRSMEEIIYYASFIHLAFVCIPF